MIWDLFEHDFPPRTPSQIVPGLGFLHGASTTILSNSRTAFILNFSDFFSDFLSGLDFLLGFLSDLDRMRSRDSRNRVSGAPRQTPVARWRKLRALSACALSTYLRQLCIGLAWKGHHPP